MKKHDIVGERVCKGCITSKPLVEFKFFKHRNQYSLNCNQCMGDLKALNNEQKRAKILKLKQLRHRLRKYNLTKAEYENLIKNQNNCCAICGIGYENFEKALFIDHNHLTGKVRGLLCIKCNYMVGLANDNIDIVKNLLKYLSYE